LILGFIGEARGPSPSQRQLQPLHFPTPAILAADEAIGLGVVRERQVGGVPLEGRPGKSGRQAANKDRLGERTGGVEGAEVLPLPRQASTNWR